MTVPGQLSIQTSSVGTTVFTGIYGTVNATVDGTGALYISTVAQGANLNMGSLANAFIDGDQVLITGSSTGINRVVYSGTGAICEVSSPFGRFIQICERSATIPTPPPLPIYTCGISVDGEFACSPSGLGITTSPTTGTAVSGGPGSQPVTTPGFTPITGVDRTGLSQEEENGVGFQFQAPGQEQAGSVGQGASTAQSAARGSGAVSAVSVAGPGVARTGTSVGGQRNGFQAAAAGGGGGGVATTTTQQQQQQQLTGASIIRQSTDDGGVVLSASADGLVCQVEDFSALRVPLSGTVAE